MAVLVKALPTEFQIGETATFEASLYKGAEVSPGELAYIWFGDPEGDELGLAAVGEVLSVVAGQEYRSARIEVQIQARPTTPLEEEELRPYKISEGVDAYAGLARKILLHGHVKIAELTHREAEFLATLF